MSCFLTSSKAMMMCDRRGVVFDAKTMLAIVQPIYPFLPSTPNNILTSDHSLALSFFFFLFLCLNRKKKVEGE